MLPTAKKKSTAAFDDVPPPSQDGLPPTNFEKVFGEKIEPLDRVRSWDEDRFEAYVHEWAFTCFRRGEYGKVVWAPGSGDKGRDVRAYLSDEKGAFDCFQCKFYKDPLTPSDAWPELAKLCLYTQQGAFRVPRKFYFVAPKDLGPELSTIIEDPAQLRARLIEAWEKTTKDGVAARVAPLTPELRRYVESFEFGIVTFKPQREILEDLKDTDFYRRKFGGGGLTRKPLEPVPSHPMPNEENYIHSLRLAFAEYVDIPVGELTDSMLRDRVDLSHIYDASRKAFYSAEQLYRFGRDTYPTAHCFEDLQDQVYAGVLGVAFSSHPHGFAKVVAVTTEAGKLALGNHWLVGLNLVEVGDRQGICHQIVNSADGRLTWATRVRESTNG
ncbi:ABC-three component system protein [Paludisphaera soli]|uniref:ABC-three component system protein n=1 Tax=Paludisphaera soli TaxID=2712865 RepID=UPI0013EC713A|nr:ABC-three component system protein [Paludisphaera soli]